MTERIARYREKVLSTKPTLCIERARFYTQAYQQHEADPIILKRAYALRDTLENMSIRIEDEDLLVGVHSSAIYAAPIFPEYAVEWIQNEIDEFEKREADAFFPDEKTKKELLELSKYWEHKTTLDKGRALFTEELAAMHESSIIRAEGNLTSGDAHIAVDFRHILERGLDWYRQEAESLLASTDFVTEEDLRKRNFYKAVSISIEAFSNHILRFANLAKEMYEKESNKARRSELKIIMDNCRAIAREKPNNFYQALQLVTFMQMVLQIESNGHSLSLGRLDQYLYPFYKEDKAKGVIEDDFVKELFENLWIKLVSVKKIRSWSHTRFSAGGPLYQNVTIGGQLRDGSDATNELSFIILKSVDATKLTQPNLSVRFHPQIDNEFLMECINVVESGFGMPAFNNDSIVIPAFMEYGVEEEDAWDYAAIGCIETAVPGKWGYRSTGKHFLNFMRVFLAAMNDGVDSVTGRQFYKGIGTLADFDDFSQVMRAWEHQIRFYAKAGIAIDTAVDIVLRDEAPDILCSAFTDYCLERGKTIHEGGSKYDLVSGLQVGIANLGDSLAAIKKLVFEDKKYSGQELMEAIQSNFENEGGEEIRQTILNRVPKFGNDDDYVDELLVEAYGYYLDEIDNYPTIRAGHGPIGCKYFGGTSSISGNVPAGAVAPATYDGRKAFKPVAEGSSPSAGADRLGPTAVMKSISKLPTDKIVGGVLLNQKLTPAVIAKRSSKEKLASMLHAFFDDLKGWHVQYNIVDRKTLLDAQNNPEEHRDLIVRVAGYSAFFTNLSRETQDDIIARTEQTL